MEAQAAIHGALAPWAGADDFVIVAHSLGNGEWVLMAFDGTDLEVLRGDLAVRVLSALHRLPGDRA